MASTADTAVVDPHVEDAPNTLTGRPPDHPQETMNSENTSQTEGPVPHVSSDEGVANEAGKDIRFRLKEHSL